MIHASPPVSRPAPDPPALGLHRAGPRILRDASPAQLEVVRRLQGSDPWRRLAGRASEAWRPDRTVHGDPRVSNLLRPAAGRPSVVLVDWEAGGRGDPALDLGGWLGELAGRTGSVVSPAARSLVEAYRARAPRD